MHLSFDKVWAIKWLILLVGRVVISLSEKSRNSTSSSLSTTSGMVLNLLLAQWRLRSLLSLWKFSGSVWMLLLLRVSLSKFLSRQISSGSWRIWFVSSINTYNRSKIPSKTSIGCPVSACVDWFHRSSIQWFVPKQKTSWRLDQSSPNYWSSPQITPKSLYQLYQYVPHQ